MYKFVHLSAPGELRQELIAVCDRSSLKGTVLLAEEGLNATVAGTWQGVQMLLDFLRQDQRFVGLECKYAAAAKSPFHRMKVRLKKEIVTMGVAGVDPARLTGKKVGYKEWNRLVADPDVLVIDARNQYEYKIGTFKTAVPSCKNTFKEFPAFVAQQLDAKKDKKVAMFCTGGIRCEKATNHLLQEGFQAVYHLSGGILKYLEEVAEDSEEADLWQGDCFVFDGRVAVDKALQAGNYVQCFACRMPLSKEDLMSADYRKGVSCRHCIRSLTDAKYAGLNERQQQVTLAEFTGRQHIGVPQQ